MLSTCTTQALINRTLVLFMIQAHQTGGPSIPYHDIQKMFFLSCSYSTRGDERESGKNYLCERHFLKNDTYGLEQRHLDLM